MNICPNAFEASPPESTVDVTISSNQHPDTVAIDDAGAGVPLRLRQRISRIALIVDDQNSRRATNVCGEQIGPFGLQASSNFEIQVARKRVRPRRICVQAATAC